MVLANQWVREEVKREIKKYLETNRKRKHTILKPMRCSKAVLEEKFIVVNDCIKKYISKNQNISLLRREGVVRG